MRRAGVSRVMWAAGAVMISMAARATAEPASLVDRTPWLPRGETELASRVAVPVDTAFPSGDLYVETMWLDLDARHSLGSFEVFGGATYALHTPNYGQVFDGDAQIGARVPVTRMSAVVLRTTWALPAYHDPTMYEWAERRRLRIDATWEWKLPLSDVIDDDQAKSFAVFGDVGLEYFHSVLRLVPFDPSMPMEDFGGNGAEMIADVGAIAQATTHVAFTVGVRVNPVQLERGSDVAIWKVSDWSLSVVSTHAAWDLGVTIATSNARHENARTENFELSLSAAARF